MLAALRTCRYIPAITTTIHRTCPPNPLGCAKTEGEECSHEAKQHSSGWIVYMLYTSQRVPHETLTGYFQVELQQYMSRIKDMRRSESKKTHTPYRSSNRNETKLALCIKSPMPRGRTYHALDSILLGVQIGVRCGIVCRVLPLQRIQYSDGFG